MNIGNYYKNLVYAKEAYLTGRCVYWREPFRCGPFGATASGFCMWNCGKPRRRSNIPIKPDDVAVKKVAIIERCVKLRHIAEDAWKDLRQCCEVFGFRIGWQK